MRAREKQFRERDKYSERGSERGSERWEVER